MSDIIRLVPTVPDSKRLVTAILPDGERVLACYSRVNHVWLDFDGCTVLWPVAWMEAYRPVRRRA